MSIGKDVKYYPKVLENAAEANSASTPIFCGNHKSVEFSLITSAGSVFNVIVASSIQRLPPDPTSPVSADNQWSTDIAFIDEENGATYNGNSPYNPNTEGGNVSKIFRFNTNGAQWIFIAITTYDAGSIVGANVTLSDNI